MPDPKTIAKISTQGANAAQYYGSWKTVQVRRDYGNGVSVFSFSASELAQATKASGPSAVFLKPGDAVAISLGGHQVINGFVTKRQASYDKESHDLDHPGQVENVRRRGLVGDHQTGRLQRLQRPADRQRGHAAPRRQHGHAEPALGLGSAVRLRHTPLRRDVLLLHQPVVQPARPSPDRRQGRQPRRGAGRCQHGSSQPRRGPQHPASRRRPRRRERLVDHGHDPAVPRVRSDLGHHPGRGRHGPEPRPDAAEPRPPRSRRHGGRRGAARHSDQLREHAHVFNDRDRQRHRPGVVQAVRRSVEGGRQRHRPVAHAVPHVLRAGEPVRPVRDLLAGPRRGHHDDARARAATAPRLDDRSELLARGQPEAPPTAPAQPATPDTPVKS